MCNLNFIDLYINCFSFKVLKFISMSYADLSKLYSLRAKLNILKISAGNLNICQCNRSLFSFESFFYIEDFRQVSLDNLCNIVVLNDSWHMRIVVNLSFFSLFGVFYIIIIIISYVLDNRLSFILSGIISKDFVNRLVIKYCNNGITIAYVIAIIIYISTLSIFNSDNVISCNIGYRFNRFGTIATGFRNQNVNIFFTFYAFITGNVGFTVCIFFVNDSSANSLFTVSLLGSSLFFHRSFCLNFFSSFCNGRCNRLGLGLFCNRCFLNCRFSLSISSVFNFKLSSVSLSLSLISFSNCLISLRSCSIGFGSCLIGFGSCSVNLKSCLVDFRTIDLLGSNSLGNITCNDRNNNCFYTSGSNALCSGDDLCRIQILEDNRSIGTCTIFSGINKRASDVFLNGSSRFRSLFNRRYVIFFTCNYSFSFSLVTKIALLSTGNYGRSIITAYAGIFRDIVN